MPEVYGDGGKEMREILFKAKRLYNGKWVEGFVWADCDSCCILRDGDSYLVDPSTVCQYTGLADKNGKKIFEGDIIKTTKYGVDDGKGHNYAGADIFTVMFADGGYCLYNKWRRFNLRPDVDIETCGSIHDGEGGQRE